MLCENKLTNLVFKNQENSAKHNLLHFPSFKKKNLKKNTQNEMHECYAMQILETEGKIQKPKNKEQWSQREKQ